MLGVYICKSCGLFQLKNPAKLKQQLKEMGVDHPDCPKCQGCVVGVDVSYAQYSQMSEEERRDLAERYVTDRKEKKILITGANGQLGHALNKLLREKGGCRIFNTSRSAGKGEYPVEILDITSEEAVRQTVREICPDLIINCAAHTGVDQCELEKEAAYAMNALGPKYLAEAAKEAGAVFVQISTDYVFRGDKEGAYVEEDEADPQTVYGSTKLAGENFTREAGGKYFIVRVSWLYGEGKNFVRTMLKLSETHKSLTVVNDQHGTPTSADELARAVLFLAERTEYGTYHASCEGETSWYLFAKKIFEYTGKQVEVLPVSSQEYKTVAKRPKNSVLENKKLNALSDFRMKDWQSALEEYLKELGY